MYFVYLARCSDTSLYTGYCNNIKAREKKHNTGAGAKYTRTRRPVKIVYYEQYDLRIDAMKREAQIKGWRRSKKENLVLKGHPTK